MAKKSERPSSMAADIIGAIREGTKKWTRTRKAEERSPVSRSYRYARMTQERGVSFKEVAAQIMEEAYLKVSGNDTLPANARQIMYAARPHIQKVTGRELRDDYFTQTLLPDYLDENDVDWNVVYDARGHFTEPHDGESFGVGTLEVRNYLASQHDPELVDAALGQAKLDTFGPSGNFGAVLFIEKEGFDPVLEAAGIADKFDLAIMSTKGMSVTAARALVDDMCSEHDIPLLLLHDFDIWVLDRRDAAARHSSLRVSERHHGDRSRAEPRGRGGDGARERAPAPSERPQTRADRQPAREWRDRRRHRFHVRGLRCNTINAPGRAQRDDQPTVHRLRRAQTEAARHSESRARQ